MSETNTAAIQLRGPPLAQSTRDARYQQPRYNGPKRLICHILFEVAA